MREIAMPKNWSNAKGWEHFYSSIYPHGEHKHYIKDFGSIGPHLKDFAADLESKGWRSIWVPGVGLSPLAWTLARHGFDVHATDISRTAIEYQRNEVRSIAGSLLEIEHPNQPGTLVCEVHDFSKPYRTECFDLILNVKAFQGFSPKDMAQIARVHYSALKPGRQAIFDTMNVQGELRDIFEGSLVEAGFFIPYFELSCWYRRALRETNIPHIFILGQPMILRTGEYQSGVGDEKWKHDITILRDITAEYQSKAQAEYEAGDSEPDETVRVATIIYSTG